MPDMRVTSLELHQKLGQMIDKARFEPVVVTKHDREHVVIVSAEHYAFLLQAARKARLTGSLSQEERAVAAAATVPSEDDQERILGELAAAVEANQRGQAEP
jgi:prevent-host-death family protein